MSSKTLFIPICILLFGLCGWCGTIAFLYQGAEWILGTKTPSVLSVFFHENAIRVFLMSAVWGLVSAFPFHYLHTKRYQWVGNLLGLPLSISILTTFYLYLWPSTRDIGLWDSVQILLAEGWVVFSASYLLCVFIPFSIWSYKSRAAFTFTNSVQPSDKTDQ
jgi:hypothetical protein